MKLSTALQDDYIDRLREQNDRLILENTQLRLAIKKIMKINAADLKKRKERQRRREAFLYGETR